MLGRWKGETKPETLLVDDNLAEMLQKAKDLVKEWYGDGSEQTTAHPHEKPFAHCYFSLHLRFFHPRLSGQQDFYQRPPQESAIVFLKLEGVKVI
jgi:hypothetical protein